jgi:hypothetical protein
MSKLKLNFATRVNVAGVERSNNNGAQNVERAKVQAMINANPLVIDRSVFEKTEQEREELRIEKAHWKKLRR